MPRPDRTIDGHPIEQHVNGEPLPDLRKVPREQWRAALLPLSPLQRRTVLTQSGAPMPVVAELMYETGMHDHVVKEAALDVISRSGSPDASGDLALSPELAAEREGRRARTTSRQVNLRLDPGEYAELERSARAVGLKPTQLARQLVLTGVRRIRYEQRRASRQILEDHARGRATGEGS
jgi:hypothetical protein